MTIIGIVEQSLRAHVYLNLPLDMPARSKALVAYLVTLKSKRGTCPSCENPICLKLNHFFVLLLFLLQICDYWRMQYTRLVHITQQCYLFRIIVRTHVHCLTTIVEL